MLLPSPLLKKFKFCACSHVMRHSYVKWRINTFFSNACQGWLQRIAKNDTVYQKAPVAIKKNRKGFSVPQAIKVNLSRQEIIGAVKSMKKSERDDFLEELLAATSPEYLKSIREARADYKAGRINTHEEVFGH
jgi:hypothetical protein